MSVKVGLWSDAVKFPSVPLMKISAYHKAHGDAVKLIEDFSERFDIAYCSKTFNLPAVRKIPQLPCMPLADEIVLGGTGFGIEVDADGKERYNKSRDLALPREIEHYYPNYRLYSELTEDTAFGFLTRGCPNGCGYCVVGKKEGRRVVQQADLSEFWRGQRNITIMDANILACDKAPELLKGLIETGANIDFTQGFDARFVDVETARLLSGMKIELARFAFDSMRNEADIIRGLTLFRRHFRKGDRSCKVYILTNYDTTPAEDWYRIQKVIELEYQPDVRIYQKGTQSHFLTDLARWANNKRIFRSCSFADYVPRKDGKRCGELYPHIFNDWKGGESKMSGQKDLHEKYFRGVKFKAMPDKINTSKGSEGR